MNWRLKAFLQQFFSHIPFGEKLNYFLQLHCTRSLPSPASAYPAIASHAKQHYSAWSQYSNVPVGQAVFYEFGAGWDLMIPLTYYCLGIRQQILVDVRKLVRPFLVNTTIRTLQQIRDELELPHVPPHEIGCARDFVDSLRATYGITYRAPCDAANTGLPSESVDCITTTNTLEHISAHNLPTILRECHRILRRGGVMSHRIDYADHYSYADRSITAQNFLRYSNRSWWLFNASLHYQNRLRHSDYLSMFRNAGFQIVREAPAEVPPNDLNEVSRMPLARRFQDYAPNDLAIAHAWVVLRKAQSAASPQHERKRVSAAKMTPTSPGDECRDQSRMAISDSGGAVPKSTAERPRTKRCFGSFENC
jgi:hypothetical protein